MEFCPECGTKNSEGATNCANCGVSLGSISPAKPLTSKSASTQQSEKPKYCGECGAQNQQKATFCGNCGKSMSGNINTTPSQNTGNFQQTNQNAKQFNQHTQPQYSRPHRMYNRPDYQYGPIPPNFRHPGMKSIAVAMIISIVLPGFAYLYTGRIASGIVYFFLTIFLYSWGIGLFIHLYMIYAGKKQVDIWNYNVFASVTQGRMY